MMAMISLIDFWRLQRKQAGEPCIIRPFHRKIADALTHLVLGKLSRPNLMILMPPRCCKTDLGVKAFIPWAHSYFPDSESIVTGYGADLATASVVNVRNTLSTEWYRSMIDSEWGAHVKMSGEKAGGHQDYFHTEEGGSVKAVGIGGAITGFGAGKLRQEFGGLAVIDDPLKAQERRSAAARRNCVEFYNGALKTRRNRKDTPKTPILLIMQRLHPDDLAGYCLANEREEWTVLQVPAHDEECRETIWPGRLSLAELLAMKEANPEDYWSQYQQSPSESAATIFKKAWWKYWNDIKAVEVRLTLKIITGDTAFKAKDSADFSSLQCWGFEGISGTYLLDRIKGRWEFPELLQYTKNFIKKHTDHLPGVTPATLFYIEDKASGQSLIQTMRRENVNVRAWSPPEMNAADDKVGRANQCTLPISAGRIYLPDPKMPGFQWVDGFIQEHSAFTQDDSHLNDDDIDAQMMATLTWLKMGGGRGPIPIWDKAA